MSTRTAWQCHYNNLTEKAEILLCRVFLPWLKRCNIRDSVVGVTTAGSAAMLYWRSNNEAIWTLV
ncbi:hypothetical protein WG68_09040 [Arsukibacterium ikkense]|uniref:Uncharacterized protein n=1 Tax=Arsukibacterium ikkense TaxID=336831 RepID=A0A0M2V858_9GAMM|nr:hypothetical protein WG68_09040 [Arsukibacterium ikkense]